jgi:N-methylhydantoinase B
MTLNRAGANEAVELSSKVSGLSVNRGDILSLKTSGGGGHGDPSARDVNAQRADLADGYVAGGDRRRSR